MTYSTATLTFRFQANDIKAEITIVPHMLQGQEETAVAVPGAKQVSSTQK